MKVMQIKNGIIYQDMTSLYKSSEEALKYYDNTIKIIDTPDYVFPGWGYNSSLEGDAKFIKPTVPDGMIYDEQTGTVFNLLQMRYDERSQKHAETSNDTLQALRKLREGDQSYDWQSWLDKLDTYNKAIEDTKNQEEYPLRVVYPEYPKKPGENI